MLKSDFKISDKAAQGKKRTNIVWLGIIIAAVILFQNNLLRPPPKQLAPSAACAASEGADCIKIKGRRIFSFQNLPCNPPQLQGRNFLSSHEDTKTHNLYINPSSLSALVAKLWQQESGGRLIVPDGDNGDAVGPLQLHTEVLKDVNKYYGTNFTDSDRRDLEKSKQIAAMYISMWMPRESTLSKFSGQGGKFTDKSRARQSAEEIAVRIFNGGPRGWRSDTGN